MAAPASPVHAPLAFQEGRACKEWLEALALNNIPQAQAQVLEALRHLNAAEPEPLERLKCLELMRGKIAFLQGEQRARYFGKSLPLSANDEGAWSTGLALLAGMEAGYRRAAAAADELPEHRALCEQRIVRYLGAQMLFHASIYRRFDPALWQRLHRQYRAAEEAGLAGQPVKDSLESDERASSVAEAYLQAVMLQAAYLSELSAAQIDFVEALLRQWIGKVGLHAAAPDAAAPQVLAVDLEGEIGARPLAPAELTPTHRAIEVSALSSSLRKRIQALRKDKEPVSLGLPSELGAVATLHLLQRLHRLWCEGRPPRPPARIPEEKTAGFGMGAAEIWSSVSGGKPFEEPGNGREHGSTPESWIVVDEMLGAWRLQRPPTSSRGVAIGRLATFRAGDKGAYYLGVVSALVQETDGRLILTVTLFPGRPEAIAARARANAKWSEAFRLPALQRPRVPGSLIVASGIAARARTIEVLERGEVREVALGEILERGADFDRVAIA